MHYFAYKPSSSSFLNNWIIIILFNLNNVSGSKKCHHSLSMENSESDSDKLDQDYVGIDYNEGNLIKGKKYLLKI